MWREDDIWQLEQGMIGRRRLLHIHVEGGPGEMAALQRIDEGGFVDDPAAHALTIWRNQGARR